MTPGSARRAPDAVEREPGRVRLVLDVEFTLDEVVTSLLRAELMKETTVDVVLVLPRLSWTSDAALVMSRGRRLAQARQRRIEELARIAGPRAAQLNVSVRRHRGDDPRRHSVLPDRHTDPSPRKDPAREHPRPAEQASQTGPCDRAARPRRG